MIYKLQKQHYNAVYELTVDELGYDELDKDIFYKCLDQMDKHADYDTYVMELEQIVVGYIGICRELAYNYEHYVIQITALSIREACQHKGVGTALIHYVEELANIENVSVLLVNSGLHRLSAHSFYEQNGFIKKGFVFKKYR